MSVTDLPQRPTKSIVGPPITGNHVVVEDRIIPRLRCHDHGDEVSIILDDRYEITVPAGKAYQVAWIVAQAMAIGQGYSHLGAGDKQRPFAPQLARLAEIT